ncbi:MULTISPECIES: DUF4870 domain-containing protein [Staphylococcus]|uniref:DUF4870 domain-containing protein n=1 Tax=Staphylococcus hsinchuensis TaxID=3051183 RepID=A0ABZ3EE61_9STAP|nr:MULTISPECIES: DUF4870 domain-containing protein [unclassified Staphylococcus]
MNEFDTKNPSQAIQNQPTDDDRLMAALIYVSSFFGSFIAPLIIWIIKRDESTFIDRTGKNYWNFFISYSIWLTISTLLMFILIGIIIAPIIAILMFIFTIVGAIKAYQGEDYLPPLSIPFFK